MDFIFGLFKFAIFLALVMGGLALFYYNKLQGLAQEVKERASNVQVAISKKLSLVNQLIDLVKGYQEAEQFTLLKMSQDQAAASMAMAYQQTGSVLASLQGLAARSPELKSNEQYHRLAHNIEQCESEIQNARKSFNSGVKEYNSLCLSFPTVLVAKFLGFSSAPYLEFDVSGANDVTRLKEFKTDDGERLQQLLSGAGGHMANAGRALASGAEQAGKMIAARIKEKSAATYFYMPTNGVPKGPLPIEDIRLMLAQGKLDPGTRVARVGTEHWQTLASLDGETTLLLEGENQA
jgi:LemA protein